MLEKTGVPDAAQIEGVFPNDERLLQGPVAVIECFQHIPCDPCCTACPKGAIMPFEDINDIPVIDEDACNGCGICLTKCPGLAIMIVDSAWSEERALVGIPYEFRPLPEPGQIVLALNREGIPAGKAEVVRVLNSAAMNRVPIVYIAVDKSLIKIVRHIRIEEQEASIACRCNDLDLDEIRDLIAQGHRSIDELKRAARLGMGPCQGRNCIPIALAELSRTLGVPMAELLPQTYRPVVKAIKLGDLADYEIQEAQND